MLRHMEKTKIPISNFDEHVSMLKNAIKRLCSIFDTHIFTDNLTTVEKKNTDFLNDDLISVSAINERKNRDQSNENIIFEPIAEPITVDEQILTNIESIELIEINELSIIDNNNNKPEFKQPINNTPHDNEIITQTNAIKLDIIENIIKDMMDWNSLFDSVIDHHQIQIKNGKLTDTQNLLCISKCVSINRFIDHTKKYNVFHHTVYVHAIILLHRFIKHQVVAVTNINKNSLYIMSLIISHKILEDIPFNNKTLTQFVGAPLNDLNIFEIYFLFGIDFDLNVNIDEYNKYQLCIFDVCNNYKCLVLDDTHICL